MILLYPVQEQDCNNFSSALKYNLQVLASQVELVCTECRGEGALAQTLAQEQVPQ